MWSGYKLIYTNNPDYRRGYKTAQAMIDGGADPEELHENILGRLDQGCYEDGFKQACYEAL